MCTPHHRYAIVLLLALSSCQAPAPTADECLPSYGTKRDGCVPQCLTQAEIDDLGDICDIDCVSSDTDGEPTDPGSWTCEVVAGACAVAE